MITLHAENSTRRFDSKAAKVLEILFICVLPTHKKSEVNEEVFEG